MGGHHGLWTRRATLVTRHSAADHHFASSVLAPLGASATSCLGCNSRSSNSLGRRGVTAKENTQRLCQILIQILCRSTMTLILASFLSRGSMSLFSPFWRRPLPASRVLSKGPHNRLDRCLGSGSRRLCCGLEGHILHANGTRLGCVEHRPLASPRGSSLPFCHA